MTWIVRKLTKLKAKWKRNFFFHSKNWQQLYCVLRFETDNGIFVFRSKIKLHEDTIYFDLCWPENGPKIKDKPSLNFIWALVFMIEPVLDVEIVVKWHGPGPGHCHCPQHWWHQCHRTASVCCSGFLIVAIIQMQSYRNKNDSRLGMEMIYWFG